MMNLLSNAFKYTPDHGTIDVKVTIANNELLISVYNTGKGIPEAEIQQVFERFRILDNMEQNSYMDFSSRNGLGLAICYSMIRMLKGRVDVKSEVDKYAEFVVYLPLVEENCKSENEVEAKSEPGIPAKVPKLTPRVSVRKKNSDCRRQ